MPHLCISQIVTDTIVNATHNAYYLNNARHISYAM